MLKNRGLHLASVFLIAFLVLSFNVWKTSIASGWIDPILHYGAQDEATYTHESIRMLTQGDWMTPTLLGRWVLEKPPLLIWLCAASMKILGIGPFAARLPALLAGGLVTALCFGIAQANRSTLAGVAAALLCLGNQLLFTLSRHAMTDILLTASLLVTLNALARDPGLERRRSQLAFTSAIAAGILTKSIAGLLPVFAALLFAIFGRDRVSARLRRTALLSLAGVAIALPWFLYHLIAHREWFLADTGFQILTIGINPHQNLSESHVVFYLERLLYAAPVASALWITALPALIRALLPGNRLAWLLACYVVVLSVALLTFRFESVTYLAPMSPVLILIASMFSPLLGKRFGIPVVALLVVGFCVKAANPESWWGISYESGSTVPAAEVLSHYCEERRANGLSIFGVEDQLYAMALPLAHLSYGWVDPGNTVSETHPHLEYLGILQHASAPPDLSLHASRLRAWGLNSTEPLATGIIAHNIDELVTIVVSHPESDFLVSPNIARKLAGQEDHTISTMTPDYVLLESKVALPAGAPQWTCQM